MSPLMSRVVYAVAILVTAIILLWIVDHPAAGQESCVEGGEEGFRAATGECVTPTLFAQWYSVENLTQVYENKRHFRGDEWSDFGIAALEEIEENPLRRRVSGLDNPTVGALLFGLDDAKITEVWERRPKPVYSPPWRKLVKKYYPKGRVEEALAVMACESGGNPDAKNRRSTAAGLMQFLRSTWDRHAPALGFGSYDSGAVYDPEMNVALAAHLGSLYEAEGRWWWGAWACKRVVLR